MIDVLEALKNEVRTHVETYCEGRARSVYLGEHQILCRVLGHYPMVVDGRDTSVAPHLALSGYWEYPTAQAMARFVEKGMRCIDVGANFGFFTVLLGHLVGAEGAVQAWEPACDPFRCLRRSLALNGLTGRVELARKGASDRVGEAELTVPGDDDRLWGSARVSTQSGDGDRIDLAPIDSSPFAQQPVDFVKIDAEGHEPEVWRGMAGLIERSPNLNVLMEFAPAFYAEPGALLDAVQRDGFHLHRLDAFEGRVVPTTEQQLLEAPDFSMIWLTRKKTPAGGVLIG